MEISLFVKDDGKKHLVTITEAIAYLKPLLKDGRKRTWLNGQDLGGASMTGGVR